MILDKAEGLPRILVYDAENTQDLRDYLGQADDLKILSAPKAEVEVLLLTPGAYDLCIVGSVGVSAIEDIRRVNPTVPILFIASSQKASYVSKIFKAGANDYVLKPYSFAEVYGRTLNLLRNHKIEARHIQKSYRVGVFLFDVDARQLTTEEDKAGIKLTKKEAGILALLCAYKNEVVPKDLLLKQFWPVDNFFNKRSLDVYICRLRGYLAADSTIILETVSRQGYSLKIS